MGSLPPQLYGRWDVWASLSLQAVGFEGLLTVDARHAILYSSGRISGLIADVTDGLMSCVALHEGHLIVEAVAATELPVVPTRAELPVRAQHAVADVGRHGPQRRH